MCGIFGYFAHPNGNMDLARVKAIARVTEARGPHAFGFAWVDGKNRLRMFKQTGRISDHLGILAMAADARMLIGHCRFATHGAPENNLNNHPHPCDGGWLVHNGVIGHHERLAEEHDLAPVTECDSEVLALLIETAEGNLADRVAEGVRLCARSALATMALWRSPARMVVARANGQPLRMGQNRDGFYLASLEKALPPGARLLADDSLMTFRVEAGRAMAHASALEIVV